MSGRRPVGAVDNIWLNMDQPSNLMVIDSVMWFDGSADWDRISAIKPHLKRIPLIGNGDLDSPQKVVEALSRYDVDGVMIDAASIRIVQNLLDRRRLFLRRSFRDTGFLFGKIEIVADKNSADDFSILRIYRLDNFGVPGWGHGAVKHRPDPG